MSKSWIAEHSTDEHVNRGKDQTARFAFESSATPREGSLMKQRAAV